MKTSSARALWIGLGFLSFVAPSFAVVPATTILQSPLSQQVNAGASVGLVVLATGENLRYQWKMNGTNLPAQTNSSLVLLDAQPANTGSYWVQVAGSGGTADSYIARVEVNVKNAASTPVALSGWNEAVILSSSYPYVTSYFDDYGYNWFESGFESNPDGVPASGSFTSVVNPDVLFQFQPDGYNDVLKLDIYYQGTTGILTLDTPAAYKSLSILAVNGLGDGFGKLAFNFVDGTTSPALPFTSYDWFTNSPSLAIAGLGRANYNGSEWIYDNDVTGFGMFETDFDLTALGLSGKKISSVSFVKSPVPQSTGIFAVSGVVNGASIPTTPPPPRTVIVTVPGVSDPWLAGMPNGSTASGGDTAPFESPAAVSGLPLTPGDILSFLATGSVLTETDGYNDSPEGDWSFFASHSAGAQNGFPATTAPVSSLIGVFLGPGQPNLSATPAALNFATASSLNSSRLEPALKQFFFIGDGLTALLAPHQIVVPHGATRLFLGVMNTAQWSNDSGYFYVTVTEANPVSLSVSLAPAGGALLTVNASLGFTNLVQSIADLSTTNWVTLTNLAVTASPYEFTDTNSVATRFYRVVQLH